jgi:hypothetical protein
VKAGTVEGYIALGSIAFFHLFDVVLLYTTVNFLRTNIAKLPPMDFAEFLRGNTLAQVSLAAFAIAIVCFAPALAGRYRRPVFWSR